MSREDRAAELIELVPFFNRAQREFLLDRWCSFYSENHEIRHHLDVLEAFIRDTAEHGPEGDSGESLGIRHW